MNDDIHTDLTDTLECDIFVYLKCNDGDIKVPFSLATTSLYIIKMIREIGINRYLDSQTPISINLSKKHIHYYSIDRIHHHLPKNLYDIYKYSRTLQGSYQSIDDQIIICEALIELNVVDKHKWIDRIIENDFYFEKDISVDNIKNYFLSNEIKFILKEFLIVLKKFKKHEIILKDYIISRIRSYQTKKVIRKSGTI